MEQDGHVEWSGVPPCNLVSILICCFALAIWYSTHNQRGVEKIIECRWVKIQFEWLLRIHSEARPAVLPSWRGREFNVKVPAEQRKSDAVDRPVCAQWAPATAANRMHAWRQWGGEGPLRRNAVLEELVPSPGILGLVSQMCQTTRP